MAQAKVNLGKCWVQGCTVNPPQYPCPKHGRSPDDTEAEEETAETGKRKKK